MSVKAFITCCETCTAVITMESETGEAWQGPISIGYFTSEELWIECEGARINLPTRHLKDIIKQIKRTEKLALETAGRK
jgi:hypothetical protein